MKPWAALQFPIGLLATSLLLGRGCPVSPPPSPAAPEAAGFAAELRKYVDATRPLRTEAEKKIPDGNTPEKQAEVLEKRRAFLAGRLRAARQGAKPGDLFTSVGTAFVKRTLAASLRGPAAAAIRDGLEEQNDPSLYKRTAQRVALNRPIAAPLVPAVLTVDLPPLPKEVEYRFLGRTLILTDTEAICVLDYIHDALPETPPETHYASPTRVPERGASPPFLAMPRLSGSVRFAALGDTGTGGLPQRRVSDTLWNYYSQGNRFKFILLLGDNLYSGLELASDYRRQFLDPYRRFLDARVQFRAVLGNHDLAGQVDFTPFNMGGRSYYSFKERNVKFVALDTNEPNDLEQRRWLEKELAGEKGWRICFFHHPLYSSGEHALEAREMRSWLEEDLVRNQVNVVFSGHEHFYERSKPQRGIQYFVDGGGAKVRSGDLNPHDFTAFGYDRENSMMIVEIAGEEMFFQALGVSGRTLDCGVIYRTPEAAAKGEKDKPTQFWLRECTAARRWLTFPAEESVKLSKSEVSR